MAADTLTRWLLRLFADKWTNGLDSDSILLFDRDDKAKLDVDTSTSPTTLTRSRPQGEIDLSTGNAIGVALTNDDDEPAGLGGNEYRSTPTLSVRVSGASTYDNGHITDADEFQGIVDEAKDIVRNVDNGDLLEAPVSDWHVAEPGTTNPQMSDYRSAFIYQFDVEPIGYRQV